MDMRQLGNSDVKVTPIILGTWAIGGLMWGRTDEKDSIEAIDKSIELGVTTLDTAPIYGCGLSEEIVGRAIAGRRDRVQILTKFGVNWETDEGTAHGGIIGIDGRKVPVCRNGSRKRIIHECEQSLRRLRTDYIDLYQHHWPDPATPIEETFTALEKLLQEGKIRAVGVSNYTPELMSEARRHVPLASVQPPYSMINRGIEENVLPFCRKHDVGVIVYSPMQRGLLTGKIGVDQVFPPADHRSREPFFKPENRRQVNDFLEKIRPIAEAHNATLGHVAIQWVRRQPGVTAALVGARNARQAEENACALDLKLSDAEWREIDRHLAGVKLDLSRPAGSENQR
ncbi:MAG: aldo/keto reductase [bacterium]|nr:aldo/keto reductase [bacterium]